MVKILKSISNKIYWSALILIASCLLTWAAVELDGDGNGGVDITKGGTNSTTASAARTALGLAIGTNVQAYDADTAKTDVAETLSAAWDLGTPSALVITNASGTASININGTVGATTPAAGAFTTLSVESNTIDFGDVTEDYVLTFNAATNTWAGEAATGGGAATTVDAIGDAAGAGAVDFVTYLQQWDVGSGSWQVGDGGSNYVQFSTTGITFGGTYSMSANLVSDYVTFTPAATTPATTDGLLRNVTGLSGIASDTFAFWDGAAIQYLFNYDTLPSVNGAVPTYNASTDDFDWTVPSIPVVASSAEINTGTDNDKFVSADALAGSNLGTKEVSWTIYDSDTDTAVADGKQFFIVPASMAGMNLIDLAVGVHDLNSATGGATTVVLRRVRTNTAVDMTSTGTTVAYNEYYASDETVDTDNDDLAAGDRIFPDVNAVTTGAVQKGLSVTALFRLP